MQTVCSKQPQINLFLHYAKSAIMLTMTTNYHKSKGLETTASALMKNKMPHMQLISININGFYKLLLFHCSLD